MNINLIITPFKTSQDKSIHDLKWLMTHINNDKSYFMYNPRVHIKTSSISSFIEGALKIRSTDLRF